jgi:Prion-inhibition and propagation
MDPLSLSFGILGILSLGAACADSYRLITYAIDLGKDGSSLLTQLYIEQARYYLWLKDMGFLEAAQVSDLHDQLGTMAAIQVIVKRTMEQYAGTFLRCCQMLISIVTLKDIQKLLERYRIGEMAPSSVHDPNLGGLIQLPDEFWIRNLKSTHKDCIEDLREEARRNNRRSRWRLDKKFTFAAVHKEKLTELINNLRLWNDSLLALFHRTQHLLGSGLPSLILPSISDPAALNTLANASRNSYDALSQCAMFKRAIESQQNKSKEPPPVTSLSLDRKSILLDDDSLGPRTLATFSPGTGTSRVLVEWKSYDDTLPKPILVRRIYDVAFLLQEKTPKPAGFRVLDALGYFHDPAKIRYGLVFRLPAHASPTQPPTSLYSLLRESAPRLDLDEPKDFCTFPLGDRFALARTVCTAFLQLHSSGWVHKSPRSSNIVFFSDQAQANDLHLPFILGFDYARPLGPSQMSDRPIPQHSNDIYRHPDYQFLPVGSEPQHDTLARKYQIIYDVYSIGLILVEIGMWHRINVFWKPGMTSFALQDHVFRNLWRLESLVGKYYTLAVRWCLQGAQVFELSGSGQNDTERMAELLEAYQENVVLQLQKCAA